MLSIIAKTSVEEIVGERTGFRAKASVLPRPAKISPTSPFHAYQQAVHAALQHADFKLASR